MRAATVEALLAAIRMRLPLHPDAEVTLEANPGTAEAAKFEAFRASGVNRLSVGVQSFDNARLAALGRIHDSAEAHRAIDMALTHFERVNIDLMYALPGQTLAGARQDIATAIAAGVSHISAYHLTLEPNTPFHHTPPSLPDEDLAADMQDMVEAELEAAGFEHYETSAFARPGERCRHNLNYWNFGDYLGIGAGAHGKLSNHEAIWREARHRSPRGYLDGAGRGEFVSTRQDVSRAELPGEFMMNALRLTDGFPVRLFTERTGLPLTLIEEVGAGGPKRRPAGVRRRLHAADAAGPAFPQPAARRLPLNGSGAVGQADALRNTRSCKRRLRRRHPARVRVAAHGHCTGLPRTTTGATSLVSSTTRERCWPTRESARATIGNCAPSPSCRRAYRAGARAGAEGLPGVFILLATHVAGKVFPVRAHRAPLRRRCPAMAGAMPAAKPPIADDIPSLEEAAEALADPDRGAAPAAAAPSVASSPAPARVVTVGSPLMGKILQSTYAVVGSQGHGTGVAIEPDRLLTNCHVIAPNVLKGKLYAISAVTGAAVEITEAAFLVREDACVVHAPGLGAQAIPLGDTSRLQRGARLHNVGFGGGNLTLAQGLYLGSLQRFGQYYMLSTNSCSPGVSGGPLVDDEGRLIGLTSGGARDSRGNNVCASLTVETARLVLSERMMQIDAFPPNYLTNWTGRR
jgi:putative oxygen-independent coproporphyrinogen III oxidase